MNFNEDSRVKLPSILHLTRLGYQYLSLKNARWDEQTNIFTNIFRSSIKKINDGIDETAINRLLVEIRLELEYDDLGKAFYERLTRQSGTMLIDFENFERNTFHVVTELTYKNEDEEFRPDVIILVNGMPLVFIEVKKPNNRDGVIAERRRINKRFQNKKFRGFVNITQFMIFSNNMEYDVNAIQPIQGVFYASPSYYKPIFNYFREEEELDLSKLLTDQDDDLETAILKDNNLASIKHTAEFKRNKQADKPTNRILTSLLSKDRLAFLLRYSIAYVKTKDGLQKHIMRYPQLFATKAIARKLDEGTRKGIIWHTQGSGKTALAYFNVAYLTAYFQQQNIIPKFYFIVDRLDLLKQAKREFLARGLSVHTVNSKDEFAKDIKKVTTLHNLTGKPEITVVNIHKFSKDSSVVKKQDYDVKIQSIYFLDEVHRSYNPKGSFLANLFQSDTNSIKIGLTGTPLISKDYYSKHLFGDYIHKYYYNASIADGYTLKLIREEIESNYKIRLKQALEKIEVLEGDISKREVYAHPQFVEPMLDYIIKDLENSRIAHNDNSIGGMVVCDSSDQAKMMFEIFTSKNTAEKTEQYPLGQAAELRVSYRNKQKLGSKVTSAALILHDVGSKEEIDEKVTAFKEGKIDFLFVYNMLLTGFDAPRLKKLYIGRLIKKHNLLQTLTRVNRTYKEFRYGYVVDFADIRKEFDATNKAYFDELQSELGDEMESYSELFKSKEEIEAEIEEIKDILFQYDTQDKELFSEQISVIEDRKKVLEVVKALGNAKSLYNLIRLFGHYELLEKIDFNTLNRLYIEANNHLNFLNQKEALENKTDTTNLLNIALEDVIFSFVKVGEEELILADKLKDTLRKTREAMAGNFDKKDPKFTSLYAELERLFKHKKLNEVTQEDMRNNIGELNAIHKRTKELNRTNALLKAKYEQDEKYARIHKRLMAKDELSVKERKLFEALKGVKDKLDEQLINNSKVIENEGFFNSMSMRLMLQEFKQKNKIELDMDTAKYINHLLVNEYMNEARA